MDVFAIWILLLSFICLIIRLIRPNIFGPFFRKGTIRKSIVWSFGLLSFIVLGITSARKPKNSSTENMSLETEKELKKSMPLSEEDKIRTLIKKILKARITASCLI